MLSFKKNKNQSNKEPDGIANSPGRGGRKAIGSPALLNEDPSSHVNDFDFNRPSGYHPSQPLVTSQLTGEGSRRETPSMINMSPVNSTPKVEEQPKKKKSLWHKIKRDVFLFLLLVIATGAYLLFKNGHL